MLEPRLVGRDPELISDGGGLPFSPAALARPSGGLDTEDPAVGALLAHLAARVGPKQGARAPRKRGASPSPLPVASLNDWRLLARTGGEALFGRGRPPQLLTVAARRESRDRGWRCVAESAARPLRATRDGIRASSWRSDPAQELASDETTLRILVTEQTFAGGRRATGRVLAPDLHLDEDELVLTMFVRPERGFQARAPNPETPVRVVLPRSVGARQLVDGAVYETTPAGA